MLKLKQDKLLDEEALTVICEALHVNNQDITDIDIMKKGMTNRSFTFRCKGKRYMIRISGVGTEKLIDRSRELGVNEEIRDMDICDPVIYIDSEKGYKISEFLENSRVCDPMNGLDVKRSMECLKRFHDKKLAVGHTFDLFGQIEKYELLRGNSKSVYADYEKTKRDVYWLKSFIDRNIEEKVLTHIDAVPDNFLFVKDEYGKEQIKLIDWEYAGMQDPHVDIAMFGIYSLYDREHMEQLIDAYFPEGCSKRIRTKIYCYIAVGGLLWSNWCEYKEKLGNSFMEYATHQYQYAKEYSYIALLKLQEMERTLHA